MNMEKEQLKTLQSLSTQNIYMSGEGKKNNQRK
jgi:hypothetical protein